MKPIETFEEYKEIVSTAKKTGYKASNCYLMPSAVKEKLASGSLFFMPVRNGVLILDRLDSFYRCYYYLAKDAMPEEIHLDQTAVIEFPFHETLSTAQQEEIAQIAAMGFRLGRESAQMAVSADQLLFPPLGRALSCVEHASLAEKEEIKHILFSNFNPFFSYLPDDETLETAILEQRVLVIHHNQSIAAVLYSRTDARNAIINQVTVDSSLRQSGLGTAIVSAYHEQYRHQVSGFWHWVDVNNTPAVKMYQKFGYQYNLRKANEYIKEKG